MQRVRALSVLGAAAVVFFSGCASMTTLQTAETLEPGKATGYVAYVPTYAPEFFDFDGDGEYQQMEYGTGEIGARIGLINNLDVGFKVYPIGALFDAKYKFLDINMFKAAGDLGFGYMTISGDNSDSKVSVIDVAPMVLLTVRPIKLLSLTLSPKGLMRVVVPDDGDNDFSFRGGGTATLKFHLGNIAAIAGEYGMFSGDMSHYAVAVEFPLNFAK